MTNLYDMERQRLKLYGQMIKQDIVERQKYQRHEKELHKKKQTEELAQHIENTRKYEVNKRKQLKGLHSSLQQDNMMLSTFKNSIQIPHTYAEQGKNFLNEIQELDSKRLDRLKRQLYQQAHENNHQTSYHRFIVEKIKQIERIEDDRHNNRIKEWQTNSIRNYQDIKKKHQQDMELYQKHKKLMEENEKYKDNVQSFTNVNHGLLDRYNRNEYMQRKANLIDNQQQIKKQMDQIQRRKSQQIIDYKKNIGDLEHSMLKSVFVKETKIQPRAYSVELKHQMVDNTMKKIQESKEKKQKIQMNNIFGGVHGKERENMLKFIDKKLGIDAYSKKIANNQSTNNSFVQKQPNNSHKYYNDNPQKYYSARSPTPRSNKLNASDSRQYHEQVTTSPPQLQKGKQDHYPQPQSSNYNYSQTSSNNPRKYYKSFDVITGKQRFYAGQ